MRRLTFAFVTLVIIVLCATPSSAARRKRLYDCQGKIVKALDRYERGWYNDSKTILDEVMMQCGGHSAIDTVVYYLGMSMLQNEQPGEAKAHFKRLVNNYTSSAFHEEAQFRLGQCSFLASGTYDRDQSDTRDAIRELGEYLQGATDGPWRDSAETYLAKSHDKLARREFEAARFYARIKKFDAAAVYFRSVMEEFPECTYVPEAHLGLAGALYRTRRITEARTVIDELLESAYVDDVKRRARVLLARIETQERR